MINLIDSKLLKDATSLFSKESNYIEVPSDKQIVFAGDTHGDIDTTENIFKKYPHGFRFVFLGDYVDRAPLEYGSIKNINYLLRKKLKDPTDVFLLRGNHEFSDVYECYGFLDELKRASTDYAKLSELFSIMFGKMRYVASTQNGLIALHGGLPIINNLECLKEIPKDIVSSQKNKTVSQITWNDNTNRIDGFAVNVSRMFDNDFSILYGEDFFNKTMEKIGKNVLVRGHDYNAKGYSFHDRLLTIFTSSSYSDRGFLKGRYVAVMDDPQKKITNCKELKIVMV